VQFEHLEKKTTYIICVLEYVISQNYRFIYYCYYYYIFPYRWYQFVYYYLIVSQRTVSQNRMRSKTSIIFLRKSTGCISKLFSLYLTGLFLEISPRDIHIDTSYHFLLFNFIAQRDAQLFYNTLLLFICYFCQYLNQKGFITDVILIFIVRSNC
jgi:hypothetical protein